MAVPLTELETLCREIGHLISHGIEQELGGKDKVGFCLMLFDFGDEGNLTYISNAQREDMILALRECIEKLAPE